MKDGELEKLCDKLTKCLEKEIPKKEIHNSIGIIKVFNSKTGKILINNGYLNFVILKDDYYLGLSISELEKYHVSITNQPDMKTPNTSFVTDIEIIDGKLNVFHWDGFKSYFDLKTLSLLGQTFTK